METRFALRARLALLGFVCLGMIVSGCQKSHVAEKKEMLSLRLEHTPVREHVGPGGQEIRAKIISSIDLKEGGGELFYKKKGSGFIAVPMTSTGQDSEYVAVIPQQPKGTTVWYYIQASSVVGRPVTLPKNAATTGKTYVLVFKDRAPVGLLALYVGCMLLGLFLLLVAGYWAVLFLRRGEKLGSLAKAALGGTILLFLGTVPFGLALQYQVFGTLGIGIPRGMAMTDSRTLLLVLFWIAALFLFKGTLFKRGVDKNLVSDKTFAALVLIGVGVTIIAFLVP